MVLACLEGDEEGLEALAAAEALAAEAGLRLVVVRVWGAEGARERARTSPTEWTLRTDSPVEPLLGFTRRNRVRHVVLGPRAWEHWGQALLARKRPGTLTLLRP